MMYGNNKRSGRKFYKKAKRTRMSPYKAGYLAGFKAGKYRARARKFGKKRWQ